MTRMRRWLRERPWAVAFLVLALANIVAFGLLHEQNRKVEAVAQSGCTDRQSARAAVRQVTETVQSIIAGSSPDYSAAPGFDALDPATKAFLSSTAADPSFRDAALAELDRALADLPPIVCPAPNPRRE